MIDLGEVSAAWLPQEELPATPRARRVGKVAVPVLVVLATLVASAGPRPPPMHLVASLPVEASSAVLVHGEQAFLVGEHTISAYSLVDGRHQWTTSTGDTTPVQVTVTATTVIASDDDGNGTGITVTALDNTNGTLRWTTRVPATCEVARDPGATDPAVGLVEFCGDTGVLSMRDLDTGRPTAQRSIGAPGSSGAAVGFVGDLIFLERLNDEQMAIDVFRAGDLTRLWGRALRPDSFLYACAPGVCEVDGTRPGMTAKLDPTTGREIGTFATPQSALSSGPPSAFPPTDGTPTTLVLLPVGADPVLLRPDRYATFTYPVPDGEMAAVPAPGTGSTWVVRQTPAGVVPIQHLAGVRANSCFAITTYVACLRPDMRLAIWLLP